LFFYAGDRDEPPDVHIERDNSEAKFWFDPIRLSCSHGFAAKEIKLIENLIAENQQVSLDAWNEFFNG